jgi:D-isomer specific 2-hydroxyacid dehydrogenase, catalytic domain/D-isomer specific 2-hydroxyacid dehydrogenase, NAD binding domain
VNVLFGRDRISADLSFDTLAPLLPGWQLTACPANQVIDHLDGVDVVCPFGARIDARIIAAGTFGLVHQFGVGLDSVDVDAATEHGVWAARVPGDESGNADSCAELAVLLLLALARRLDESRAILAARRWPDRPLGRSLLDATVLIAGLGAIGTAVARRLAPLRTAPDWRAGQAGARRPGRGRVRGRPGPAAGAARPGRRRDVLRRAARAEREHVRRGRVRGDAARHALRQRRAGRPGR